MIRESIFIFLLLTLLTGVAYPLAVTGVAQVILPHQANGSMFEKDGRLLGSELIGQPFDQAKYFWPRPSATGPHAYNAGASSGSNLAVSSPAQLDAIRQRVQRLRDGGVPADQPIPIDLVTASGSGLDPHISPAAARLQAARVAWARNVSTSEVQRLIAQYTEPRQLGFLGEPVVNVLLLNLAIDGVSSR